ncbi:S1C family serine protease [Pontibacillus salicampi]|uniref:S1C family serine protease n=1 Tax=Pontibacillus salicampi TaxID=1449801 RepID=A0ABV6LII7_9BACI
MKKQRMIIPLIVTVLIIGLTCIGAYWMNDLVNQDAIKATSTLAHEIQQESSNGNDLKTVIHKAEKNVVQIEATGGDWENIGSGFLINDKGDIVTNAHVVKGSESILVKTADARTYPAAIVEIGKETDIALLRVPSLSNRTPVETGQDVQAEIGDDIVAVGSPLGLQNSVTIGIISGKNRVFEIDDYRYVNAYQISAPITNGNSGGPLIHRPTGKVIAINSAGTEKGAIGFSIPLADIMPQVEQWSKAAENKDLHYGSIGPSTNISKQQMKEDARYLFGYFNESVRIRDYITAYSLLGSELQKEQDYTSFREAYVHTIGISVSNLEVTVDEDNRATITAKTEHIVRQPNEDKQTIVYNVVYSIGYENEQLKILEMKEENISPSSTQKVESQP